MTDENIIEAVLFTMGKSVELRQLAVAIDKTQQEAREAVGRLIARYREQDRAMQIIELEDAYQMCTKAEYFDSLIRVAKAPKKQVLTEAVLETLSIIAYKQPITKAEIEKIRGVSSEYSVNKLMEYGLVNEAGRLDAPGRPALFATTEEFLRRFALDSAQNLPRISGDSEAEIMKEAEEEAEYQLGFTKEEKKEWK